MATRVRKLSRELGKTAAEVLGLLHELGYVRYKSTEDQVADVAVERVREAIRLGVKAKPVEPVAEPKVKAGGGERGGDDFMAKIVPGLTRRKLEDHEITARTEPSRAVVPAAAREARAQGAPSAAPKPTAAARAPENADVARWNAASDGRVEVERARLEVERASIEVARLELADARKQLERARVELSEARAQVERSRVELEQERVDLESARAELQGGGVSLAALLEERGLRGADEQQRALSALAAGRHLGPVLADVRVADRNRFVRLLEDRLVLVGGDVPAALQGVAAVTVAPTRADVPDTRELERLLHEVGEQLLLSGLRRLVVINAAPRWHKLLREGLDRRIELLLRPAPTRELGAELSRVDAVALWRIELPADIRPAWQANLGQLVLVTEVSLAAFLTRLRDRLRGAA